jgi:predicted house-cleaning NTP pyrophosphatase (Maf/HAM1 superfamily)
MSLKTVFLGLIRAVIQAVIQAVIEAVIQAPVSPAAKTNKTNDGMTTGPSLVRVVALDAMLFLDRQLQPLKPVNQLVNRHKILHRLSHQALQFFTQALVLRRQILRQLVRAEVATARGRC